MIASVCKKCKTPAMPGCAESCKHLHDLQIKAIEKPGLKTEGDSIHEYSISPGVVRSKKGSSH